MRSSQSLICMIILRRAAYPKIDGPDLLWRQGIVIAIHLRYFAANFPAKITVGSAIVL